MEQHRVPQDIATYQFRLVGDMTLKQFGELAGGAILAFIFYSSPLAPILKWPLVMGSAFLGAALAFMPVGERPLDRWIINFFKSIYSPTQYLWQKTAMIPSFLKPTTRVAWEREPKVAGDEGKLREYLITLPKKGRTPLEKQEEIAQDKINKLFQEAGLALQLIKVREPLPPLAPIEIEPGIRVRKLGEIFPGEIIFSKKAGEIGPGIIRKQEQVKKIETRPRVVYKPLVSAKTVNYKMKAKPAPMRRPTYIRQAPKPLEPEKPNVLTGVVLTGEGKFIPGAIVSVMDKNNLPVRALKTNTLGQFFTATPLENGPYQIEVEKEGEKFDIITFEAEGEIIPPLEIRAKKKEAPKDKEVKILEF